MNWRKHLADRFTDAINEALDYADEREVLEEAISITVGWDIYLEETEDEED